MQYLTAEASLQPGAKSQLNLVWIVTGQHLDVPRTLDVLAVVAPVSGAAEPLRPQLALEHPRHLDAVLCLENMSAVGSEVLDHGKAGVPELGAGEVLAGVALEALDGDGGRQQAGQQGGQKNLCTKKRVIIF